MSTHESAGVFAASIVKAFRSNKQLADRAIAQVPDDGLHRALDANTNSIAVIMQHVAGNLRSRWTNFLTTDGEKPARDRDSEFVDSFHSRDELLAGWEAGWGQLFSELSTLTSEDFERTVLIRGVPHPVPLAMSLSLAHACYHIGQIVQLARHVTGDNWKTLTIPRGMSEQFNQERWGKPESSHS